MIEPVDSENLDEVIPLIRKYQEFYEVTSIDDQNNRQFFSQFGISSDKGCLFGYRLNGVVVAFATVYFSYSSTIISKVAIMNDLYTMEQYRCRGIGSELIKYCEKYARDNGAARLQWVTATNNKNAQSVYDALGAKHSTWEIYTYST